MRAPALAVLACAAALGCAPRGDQPATDSVLCRDLESGHTATYRGHGAIADCLRDPAMQSDGHRREALVGPGRFDFGDARRFELGSGFAIRGAGPERTTLYASRPTTSVFGDDVRSALFVRGARVELAGFTFEGDCRAGPHPGPDCHSGDGDTLLAVLVACGYGFERGPDCDVDGLSVHDLRVLHVKTPFVSTSSDPNRATGRKAVFANFRDFHWTIRRFEVSGRADGYRYARIFELGNAATPAVSQGPGAGVTEARRYVVDIEDTRIDTHVGMFGGQLAGVLTMAVNAPVSLTVNLRRSSLRGTERIVGMASHVQGGLARAGGAALFRCEDSELVADQRDWAGKVRQDPAGAPCPPFDAAVYVGEPSQASDSRPARVELLRCAVRVEGWLALCPEPASIEVIGENASACLEDSRVAPPVRGRVEPPPCLTLR